MARLDHAAQPITTLYPLVIGDFLEPAFADGQVADGNSFTYTGKEILLIRNTSADTGYDFTLVSTADETGRGAGGTANTVVEIPFQDLRIIQLGSKGWLQPGRKVFFSVENAALEVAVIRLK